MRNSKKNKEQKNEMLFKKGKLCYWLIVSDMLH